MWKLKKVNLFSSEWQQNMICKEIKIFSQNVQKNFLLINTILEVKTNFDIIFIQEPSWSLIHSIPSSSNCKEETLVGIVNHPNWLVFIRSNSNKSEYPRIAIYINIRLFSLCFSIWKDIIDYRDILLASFFNNGDIFWLMNIYSDTSHFALKYFKDTEVNIQNLLLWQETSTLEIAYEIYPFCIILPLVMI